MGWAQIQPNCIERDHNDVRKFMGHFPQAEYEDVQSPYTVLHFRQFAPAVGNPAEELYEGEWKVAIIKNLSATETVNVYGRTIRMSIEGIFDGRNLTLLPRGIITLCRTHSNTTTEVVSLGAEAELEVLLVGTLEPIPA
jgi:hypothetical protein